MVPGEVVKVRVRPLDVLGCIDVCRKAGYSPAPGTSLAQIVKSALVILLGSARAANSIPERSGFEYAQMVEPYKQASHGRKVQMGHILGLAEFGAAAADRTAPHHQSGTIPFATNVEHPNLIDPREQAVRFPRARSSPQVQGFMEEAQKGNAPSANDVKWGKKMRAWNELDIRAEHDPGNMLPDDWKRYTELSKELGQTMRALSPNDAGDQGDAE